MSPIALKLKELLDNMTQKEFDQQWETIEGMGLEDPDVEDVLNNIEINSIFEKLKFYLDNTAKTDIIETLTQINYDFEDQLDEIIFDEATAISVINYLEKNGYQFEIDYCNHNEESLINTELIEKQYVVTNSDLSHFISEYLKNSSILDGFSPDELSNAENLTSNYAFAA